MTKMNGKSRVTGAWMRTVTGMTVIAMVTRMTERTRVTGMTRMTRITRTTSLTVITNTAVKRTAHEHKI